MALMRERLKVFFSRITESPALEARWLNTVSLLEFTGARKISRTVADRHPALDVLEHIADETRHALAFKRLAVAVGGTLEPGYLCATEGSAYIQSLDRALAAWSESVLGRHDPRAFYLLTTTLIERRAMQLYPLYRATTSQESVREELRKVITEEQNHRVGIEAECLSMHAPHALDEPIAIEERLFGVFLSALEGTLCAPPSMNVEAQVP